MATGASPPLEALRARRDPPRRHQLLVLLALADLGFGRVAVSEIEAPNLFGNLV